MRKWKKKLFATLVFCSLATVAWAQTPQERVLPVPQTVSKQMQALIAASPPPFWNYHPENAEAWHTWVRELADMTTRPLEQLRKDMGVTMRPDKIGGVPVFILSPQSTPPDNKERVLLHFHGGGYVLNPGEAGTQEAILMAGLGGFKVISVDYRMAPDFPYPAAIDDAIAVYRELLATTPAEKIGVFGTSTGGAMALILGLRAKAEGLPLPAAIAAGTPWTDLAKVGDTYFTNEGVDNVIYSYDGWIKDAVAVYAKGRDLTDPMLSPVYGDLKGFPPTLLTSGTRDIFLSNTIRMHLKLREAGASADLIVFEGMAHAQYLMAESASETKFHFKQLKAFFTKNLK